MLTKPPASRWRAPSATPGKRATDEKLTVGVPLAKVIKRKLADVPEIVMLRDPRSAVAEKFRRLRTTLESSEAGNPQTIVVTSPGAEEGKSTVAVNLALAFAAERRGEVVLVDADLRRPTIDHWLTPPPSLGLTELLEKKTELEHALLSLDNSPLKVLPVGTMPREPAELLSAHSTKELFAMLRKRFQRIIVDTPPVVPFSDADILGAYCDGFLLVARSGHTRQAVFTQALSLLTSQRVLGAVLNHTTPAIADWNLRPQKDYYEHYNRQRTR